MTIYYNILLFDILYTHASFQQKTSNEAIHVEGNTLQDCSPGFRQMAKECVSAWPRCHTVTTLRRVTRAQRCWGERTAMA